MINLTTNFDATTVISAINAGINAVSVCVRGVAHSLTERLDDWLFSDSPGFYGNLFTGRPRHHRQRLQQMRQQPASVIKRMLLRCCPKMSQYSGLLGSKQTLANMACSFGSLSS